MFACSILKLKLVILRVRVTVTVRTFTISLRYTPWQCFLRSILREAEETIKFFLHCVGTLGPHFETYGLVTMSHHEGLDSSKMAFIDLVQNVKQVSQFCLDHSHVRNGRVIWKQLKQTWKTKQRNEKRLKHKLSGYKFQSKRRSIAGCRLLLRTLNENQAIKWYVPFLHGSLYLW